MSNTIPPRRKHSGVCMACQIPGNDREFRALRREFRELNPARQENIHVHMNDAQRRFLIHLFFTKEGQLKNIHKRCLTSSFRIGQSAYKKLKQDSQLPLSRIVNPDAPLRQHGNANRPSPHRIGEPGSALHELMQQFVSENTHPDPVENDILRFNYDVCTFRSFHRQFIDFLKERSPDTMHTDDSNSQHEGNNTPPPPPPSVVQQD